MTIREIYEKSERMLKSGEITLGEFENLVDVDAEPVRHGYWTDRYIIIKGTECGMCSNCRAKITFAEGNEYKYCPNCGAKMDGGQND